MDTVSLSDIAAVTRGNDNDGWGNGGADHSSGAEHGHII